MFIHILFVCMLVRKDLSFSHLHVMLGVYTHTHTHTFFICSHIYRHLGETCTVSEMCVYLSGVGTYLHALFFFIFIFLFFRWMSLFFLILFYKCLLLSLVTILSVVFIVVLFDDKYND